MWRETLPVNPFIYEILELASKQRSNAKKIEVLKTYEHDSLKTIFIWNFDETVVSLLPEGDAPYANAEEQSVYSGTLSDNLRMEAAVENLQQVKIWMVEEELLCEENIKIFTTM